jgi:hypothetical protein
MRNRTYRANHFAKHAGNVAGCINRNGIEQTDETCFLRAYSHTGFTFNAGISPNEINDSNLLEQSCR